MSTTRSRPRAGGAKTYTARLQQRTAPPRPTRPWPTWLTTRHWPTWLTTRHLPALLLVVAEAGHLTAAMIEWPAAPARGLFHILTAAGLGLLAAMVYFGHSQVELLAGIAFLLAVPGAWLAGTLLGLSPYRELPTLAAVAGSAVELTTAGLLCFAAVSASTGVPRKRSAGARR